MLPEMTMTEDLSNDSKVFRIMLSRHDLSRLTWFLKDAKIPKESYAEPYRTERDKQARTMGEEIETQFDKEFRRIIRDGTVVDVVKGTVKLPVFDKNYARDFSYKCKSCGYTLTINSDDGHLAKRYWEEHHKHS